MPTGIPKPLDETRGSSQLEGATKGEEHTGVTIFDKSEPRSVYNLVPREVQEAMDRVHPNVWQYSFKNLEKHAKVDDTLAQLRVAFWHQYNVTQDLFKPHIPLVTVMNGICSKNTFYNIIRDQFKCAYLFYPTVNYISAMLEMQDLALREMRKILKMPNAGNKGANMAVIREKIKIFALLENRLRGTVPKRLEHQHSHILEAGSGMKDVTSTIGHEKAPESLKDIEAEIRRIDRTVTDSIKESPTDGNNIEESSETNEEAPMAGSDS